MVLLMTGCGEDANFDAIIIAPEDLAPLAVDGISGAGSFSTTGPLIFKVVRSSTDPKPVPNINIEFYAGGTGGVVTSLALDPDGTIDLGGFYQTRTDDVGVVKFFVLWTTPGCGSATEDISANANVQAVISADFQTWNAPITIKCALPE